MSHWITVYEFPIDKDLSELAQFIQRYQLPLRISEENNRQVLSAADPRLPDLLQPVLERWQAGEIRLGDIRVEAVEEPASVPAADAVEKEREKNTGEEPAPDTPDVSAEAPQDESAKPVMVSPLPDWPWRQTPLCLLLIALCFIGWLLPEPLVRALLIFPDRSVDFDIANSTLAWHWAQGEYWRLWTPAIVHFSLPHALFNALGIWILGRSLEARAGTLVFALLVLVSAAVSNLVQYYWSPETPFGGMSGVVYALVGAVFILQRWRPGWRDVPSGIVALAVGWLLFCASGLFTYVFGIGIANAAHIGGFLCGILLALLYCIAGGAKKFSDNPTAA